MKAEYWLKIRGRKSYSSYLQAGASITKQKPSVNKGEIAIKLNLDIPDSYFELPELQAKISLPGVTKDNTISADVQNNIAELNEKEMGIKLHISQEQPTEENQS